MKIVFLVLAAIVVLVSCQDAAISFGGDEDISVKKVDDNDDLFNRGLLATTLGSSAWFALFGCLVILNILLVLLDLPPTGGVNGGKRPSSTSSNLQEGRQTSQYCCCASSRSSCPRSGTSSGGGSFAGGINPRDSLEQDKDNTDPRSGTVPIDINTRIVNNVSSNV